MPSSTGAKSTLFLDEAGFQQLLAAAFVLQQHNDTVAIKNPRLDSAWIFSQIAEVQSKVSSGKLNFATGTNLIADRVRGVTGSGGVSICLVIDGCLVCMADSGSSVTVPGGSIAANSALATERLKRGKPFHSSDAKKDIRLDFGLCGELGLGALLAVPIELSGEVGGLVEVRWNQPDAFHECDVRTCNLMADLVVELLQQEVTKEEEPPSPVAILGSGTDDPTEDLAESPSLIEPASFCRVCGRPFGTDETFCGNCSLPRLAASPADGLQSKWASMWFMQQAQATLQEPLDGSAHEVQQGRIFKTAKEFNSLQVRQDLRTMQPVFARMSEASTIRATSEQNQPDGVLKWKKLEDEHSNGNASLPRVASSGTRNPWQVFHSWIAHSRIARVRVNRRKAVLAIIGTVLALLLSVWVLSPAHRSSPNQLSWFESLLVELGMAEPPTHTPNYAGSPNVRVWVDIHTALYYCPGSDLYGKTPGGYYATQRAAQEDAFEPATRLACD